METASEDSASKSPPPLLAAIEAGGTKYVCSVAYDPSKPILETRFPTGSPMETLALAVDFFRGASVTYGPVQAMGIGTFGPADIDSRSMDYGTILTTPKLGWTGFNIIKAIRAGLRQEFPVAFETDVNAAVIGEAAFGIARGYRHIAYITIGTGIGGGYIHDGALVRGRMHPEIGHLLVPDLDAMYGKNTNVCPFHTSCLEGRASGPAIESRWGIPGGEIPDHHIAWELEAKYLALGCVNLTAAWSPDLIILGGGVSQKPGLIERVRAEFDLLAGGYWQLPPLNQYLQLPGLDQKAGIIGALVLAQRLLQTAHSS